MRYNPAIHNINQLAKSILGKLESFIFGINSPTTELIVVNYHGTQKMFIDNFKRQLDFFSKYFTFLSPDDLDLFYSGGIKSNKSLILLNFDDGIKNNLYAAEILNEYDIKAFFFVVPDFIDTPHNQQKKFFIKNIRPSINYNIDKEEEDFTAMDWSDLKKIIYQGHCIGSHSRTHSIAASSANHFTRQYEIISSKKRIEEMLSLESGTVKWYCSPNESLFSTSREEMKIIKENYLFYFSTYPGSNFIDKNPYFIKRSNLEISWMDGSVTYSIGMWDKKRWKNKVQKFSRTVL